MKREPLKIDGKVVRRMRRRKKDAGQEIAWQAETAITGWLDKEEKK